MELVGIFVFVMAGLVGAPAFCATLVYLIARKPLASEIAFFASMALLCLFGIDLVLVGSRGAVAARQMVGPTYFSLHSLVTLGAAPALACVLLVGRRNLARWWFPVAAICWAVGVFAILFQYGVGEALYGIDGHGGHYGDR